MSFLEIFTLFASGITIFGVIVGVFSVYNGRMTRREIGAVIQETRDLVARETEAARQLIRETRELIARESEAARQLIREIHKANRPILERIVEILARIDERVR